LLVGAASKKRTLWLAQNVVLAALPRWSGTAISYANPLVQIAIWGGAPLVPVVEAADLRDRSEFSGISSLRRRFLAFNGSDPMERIAPEAELTECPWFRIEGPDS
jgi:hypothetical protein